MWTSQIRQYLRVYLRLNHALIKKRGNWLSYAISARGGYASRDAGVCNGCRGYYRWAWAEVSEHPRLCVRCANVVRTVIRIPQDFDNDEIPF